MKQKRYITNLLKQNKGAVVIGSLGTISYDLKEIDHPKKFLVKGAMGHAIAVGIGYVVGEWENRDHDHDKIAKDPPPKVIVIIGDGAFMMKMGSIVTATTYTPGLEVHILNNGQFRSCGEQQTFLDRIEPMLKKLPENFHYVEVE